MGSPAVLFETDSRFTGVPGAPVPGVTLEIVATAMAKGTAFDQTPPCCTRALSVVAFAATVATI